MIHKALPVPYGFPVVAGDPYSDRECLGSQGQVCSVDATPLDCLNDYIGGGSHYWSLRCPECGLGYYYDTYDFVLHGDGTQVAAHYT